MATSFRGCSGIARPTHHSNVRRGGGHAIASARWTGLRARALAEGDLDVALLSVADDRQGDVLARFLVQLQVGDEVLRPAHLPPVDGDDDVAAGRDLARADLLHLGAAPKPGTSGAGVRLDGL